MVCGFLEASIRLVYCTDKGWVLDLEIALNYGQATGAAQLLRFITEHTEVCIEIAANLFEDTDLLQDHSQPPVF